VISNKAGEVLIPLFDTLDDGHDMLDMTEFSHITSMAELMSHVSEGSVVINMDQDRSVIIHNLVPDDMREEYFVMYKETDKMTGAESSCSVFDFTDECLDREGLGGVFIIILCLLFVAAVGALAYVMMRKSPWKKMKNQDIVEENEGQEALTTIVTAEKAGEHKEVMGKEMVPAVERDAEQEFAAVLPGEVPVAHKEEAGVSEELPEQQQKEQAAGEEQGEREMPSYAAVDESMQEQKLPVGELGETGFDKGHEQQADEGEAHQA